MAKKVKLEAELGLNTKKFDDNLKKSDKGVQGFGGSIISLAKGITALTAIGGILLSWFRTTEMYAKGANVAMTVTKQIIADLAQFKVPQIGLAVANAKEMNAIREEERKDLVANAKILRDLNTLQFESADQVKTNTERIQLLNQAMLANEALYGNKIKNLQRELNYVNMLLVGDYNNTVNLDKKAQLEAEIITIEAEMMSSGKRMHTLITGLIKAETEAQKDLNAEILKGLKESYGPFWAKVQQLQKLPQNNQPKSVFEAKTFGLAKPIPKELQKYSGTADQEKANMMADAVQDLSSGLTESQTALLELSDMFSGFFTNVDDGFQGMIDGVIKGIERLVVELLAKAAILAILSAITGVPMPALNTILPAGLNTLMGGSVGGTASSGLAMASAPTGGGKMTSEISGKKLKFLIDNRS